MTTALRAKLLILGTGAVLALIGLGEAKAECSGPMRQISIGIPTTPPNVVHTVPHVAKALGLFEKRCIDAELVQFEGGASASMAAAVVQGKVFGSVGETMIAQGMRAKQLWVMAPVMPHQYFVSEGIKTAADLKGKRLSAAGGVGAFNWLMGRAVLRSAGLDVGDAQFISQGLAGRLPGLIAGQLDGVALHPEDVYLATQKKPGAHSLVALAKLLPEYQYNTFGAADSLIQRDPDLLRDVIATLIESARLIYRDKDKVLPAMVKASEKPQDAVEFAREALIKDCVWSVNTGFDRQRQEWTLKWDISNGDVDGSKASMTYEDFINDKIANEAVASLGGPQTIGECKD